MHRPMGDETAVIVPEGTLYPKQYSCHEAAQHPERAALVDLADREQAT